MLAKQIYEIAVVFFTLLILDFSYITAVTPHFKHIIFNIQGSKLNVNIFSATLCYIVMSFGLYYLIIKKKLTPIDAGLFGFVIYAVFELTNKALFNKWQWNTVVIDTIWGGILFYLSTLIIQRYIIKS